MFLVWFFGGQNDRANKMNTDGDNVVAADDSSHGPQQQQQQQRDTVVNYNNNNNSDSLSSLIPPYGWSRDIQEQSTPKLTAFTVPMRDIFHFAGLGIRFFTGYYLKHKLWEGKLPTFDPFVHNISPAEQKGPPLGGIGTGSITRSWQGDFSRWGLKCGQYHNKIVHANQFSLFVERSQENSPTNSPTNPSIANAIVLNYSNQEESVRKASFSSWNWWSDHHHQSSSSSSSSSPSSPFHDMTGTFKSIFPCSYSHYQCPSQQIELVCKQFSPVIAQNYKESSYPVTVFKWTAKNLSDSSPVRISLMFTFENSSGEDGCDRNGSQWNKAFDKGVNMHQKLTYTRAQVESDDAVSDDLVFTIAGNKNVTICPAFYPMNPSSNTKLWTQFSKNGRLSAVDACDDAISTNAGYTIASAVCIELNLEPGQSDEAVFTLSWDLPITRFGQSSFYKRYTLYYPPATVDNSSNDENAVDHLPPVAQAIATDALEQYAQWEQMIHEWHHPILSDGSLPDWYKAALFHELYYVVDGGTVWTNGGAIRPDGTFDANEQHFSYLEGHEYVMFTTYDVHFYASFALIMNWPEIQLTIQRDYNKAISYEYDEVYKWCGSGVRSKRKVKNCVPHDLGTTAENPFFLVNSYHIQDTNRWKDLNCMFVLTVFRDYQLTQNLDFLREVYPAVVQVINYHLANFDKDGDGLIENEGFPDSTYDAWVCTSPSAFCGGLWISALLCAHHMANIVGDAENEQRFLDICTGATASFEQKLWNPNGYYNYDANAGKDSAYRSDTIMSDQLCGHTFLRACKLPNLLKQERIVTALYTIFDFNVRKYRQITGRGGAVNGMRPDGQIDMSLMQCKEVWTGTAYLLASCMIHEDMIDEAMETARGVYETCMQLGFWFQTPEAYDETGAYRSLGYMRPLSIWSMQLALNQHKERQQQPPRRPSF